VSTVRSKSDGSLSSALTSKLLPTRTPARVGYSPSSSLRNCSGLLSSPLCAPPILLQIHGRSSPLNRRAADLVVGGAAGLLWGAESVSRTRGSSRPSARFRPIRGGEEASATASCSASSPRRSTGGTLLVLRFRTPAPLTWFDFVR
jgi:hypothetical protein